jgi:hypothetical protein
MIVFTHSSAIIHTGNMLRVRKRKCVLARAAAVLHVTTKTKPENVDEKLEDGER